ncbi:hypothetical protein MMC29_007921, partial [Sticta canariensis]|nr:hypothetical protein [Sticta canariensis]
CIQEDNPIGNGVKKGEQKRQHTWASAGHDFKSDLTYYDSGLSNGKMTHECYREQTLEPVVQWWLQAAKRSLVDPFVLEEVIRAMEVAGNAIRYASGRKRMGSRVLMISVRLVRLRTGTVGFRTSAEL